MNKILRCSLFSKAADNNPRPWEGTWDRFRTSVLNSTYYPRPGTSGDEAKKTLAAFSGTRFKEGRTRGCENAMAVGVLVFDVDNAQQVPTGEYWPDPRTGAPTSRPKLKKMMIDSPVTFEEVQQALRCAGVASFSWTTWSNRPEWPKFRVTLPLAEAVSSELWKPATERAQDLLHFQPFRRGIDLPVLRDVARLNFLPGAPDPASIQRGETGGTLLEVPQDGLLKLEVPGIVAPWQVDLVATRDAEKEAGFKWFKAYRVAGRPVDFQSLDLAYLLSTKGVLVSSRQTWGSGSKWRCHCPFANEHSGGIDDFCAVVIWDPGKWPRFHCYHAHLGLQDMIEFVWGRP